jgi:hypothetical protein
MSIVRLFRSPRPPDDADSRSAHFPADDVRRLQSLYAPYLDLYRQTRMSPYLMAKMPMNVRSRVINTDERGFRFCIKDGRRVALEEFREWPGPTGIVVGGSVVVGSAATTDAGTLSNRLNAHSDALYWNGGVGACNGFVESLVYLTLGCNVDTVISLSGANDLLLHLGSARPYAAAAPFESELGFARWTGAGELRAAEFEAFNEVVESLPADPSDNELDHLLALEHVRRSYRGCLDGIAGQLETWRLLPVHHVYVLNPFLFSARRQPTPEEDLFCRIASCRMPKIARYQHLIVRQLYETFRRDIAAIVRARGVCFIDASELAYPETTCFIDDFHLTDVGFDALAAEIASRLSAARGR